MRPRGGSLPRTANNAAAFLAAVGASVPVRLTKLDLQFVPEELVSVMDESRVEMLARHPAIRQKRDDGDIGKTLPAFVRRAEEGTLCRTMVEASILVASERGNPATVRKEAATVFKHTPTPSPSNSSERLKVLIF